MTFLGALHSVLIELHGGMLTLATICIFAMVVGRAQRRLKHTSKMHGLQYFDSFFDKVDRYAEPTAHVAGIGGVIGLVSSGIVGMQVWPIRSLTESPLGLNKMMFAIFATLLWLLVVGIRSRYGKYLWENGGLVGVYAGTAFVGFFFTMLTGSIGGHMVGKGSILDPIYKMVGVDPEAYFLGGIDALPILLGITFICAAATFAIFLRYRSQPAN